MPKFSSQQGVRTTVNPAKQVPKLGGEWNPIKSPTYPGRQAESAERLGRQAPHFNGLEGGFVGVLFLFQE